MNLILKNLFFLPLVFVFTFLTLAHSTTRITPIVKAVQKASPSVVSISALQMVQKKQDPFGALKRKPRDFFEEATTSKDHYLGSGVIINKEGYVLTNEHVIAQGSRLQITLADHQQYPAIVQGADAELDLAILKIQSPKKINWPQIEIGTSKDLLIGESVIAIGNPFGLSQTVTTGVISGISRTVRSGDQIYRNFIQIDAPIHAGNSGGPLLNIHGHLIGINTAVLENAFGIGFAIPIDNAFRVLTDLIQFGEIRGVWFGIAIEDDSSPKLGLKIVKIDPEGPAFQAGIKPGDILEAIDNTPIQSRSQYLTIIRGFTVDNQVPLAINRNGKIIHLKVKAYEFPLNQSKTLSKFLLGIDAQEITNRLARRYKLQNEKGVVIRRVHAKKPAAKIGLRPGDVIRQIDNQKITNLEEFQKMMTKLRLKTSALFLIQRGSFDYYVTLRLDEV